MAFVTMRSEYSRLILNKTQDFLLVIRARHTLDNLDEEELPYTVIKLAGFGQIVAT